MADPRIRQLKIKTGVVKRLCKEKKMYEKEVVDQKCKIKKMKEENKDEYDVKKQIEVLEESETMIPDCKRRLKKAHEDLTCLVRDCADLSEDEEQKQANEILEHAKEDID